MHAKVIYIHLIVLCSCMCSFIQGLSLNSILSATFDRSVQQATVLQNPVYNATICSFSRSNPTVIYCPIGYNFNILNATLYDFPNCSDMHAQAKSLEFIQSFIQKLCYSDTSCPIFKFDLLDNYPAYKSAVNLGVIISWSCYQMSKLYLLSMKTNFHPEKIAISTKKSYLHSL